MEGLDLVPDAWLHLTTQGLVLADDVREDDVRAILDVAAERVARTPAFDLTLDRPEVTPEAIRWEATPSESPAEVRPALREAIGSVWDVVPEASNSFAPHISIAYSNATGPDTPIHAALNAAHSRPTTAHIEIERVELIVLNRDQRMYQ
ncbi:2'-5' RNA ligase family protein [Streptomyces piniterrae]|uniref:2'-5' RNA ligase family protein n=1 Tax=Streptomyces piniterrae TaxID=2571125 RepID=UPI001FEC8D17|nr:2'-5' RNA ligase family protein [Streptomyces piniterrae]